MEYPKNIRWVDEQFAVWQWQTDFQQPVCPIEKFGKYPDPPEFYNTQLEFVKEEAGFELAGAIMAGDKHDVADALADGLFTVLGLLNVIGAPCAAEVPINFEKMAPMPTIEAILRVLEKAKLTQDVLNVASDLVTCLERIAKDEGIDLKACFDEVVRSNNTKLWKTDEVNAAKRDGEVFDGWSFVRVAHNGWIGKDQNGKVKKSPSYSPPQFQGMISLQEQ